MMMDQMTNCSGWLMVASGITTFAVLILGGAAAIKYLFFADRGRNSAKPL